eukprot:scaffold39755_cov52-Attheya_sp.AAC.3
MPVIKVSTKDTRAQVLQLDISFDSPDHHGLEAVSLARGVMEEFPMVRPLVLVIKQFLLDRGLLTAYTGGLSSYCLFLMVTRYLQEQQSSSWTDCGSLLMGFLDFYGNSFDPRATGISVAGRAYFPRPNHEYQGVASVQNGHKQPLWNVHPQVSMPEPLVSGPSMSFTKNILRRHSFSEKGNMDSNPSSNVPNSEIMDGSPTSPKHSTRPPRFESSQSLGPQNLHQDILHMPHRHVGVPIMSSARPYTFDPLFIEDPLSAGNNVGRNAFRIFQVQRAFADAHRALVASLEWDMGSEGDLNDESSYPLLKCLLQNEDMFFELDDHQCRP